MTGADGSTGCAGAGVFPRAGPGLAGLAGIGGDDEDEGDDAREDAGVFLLTESTANLSETLTNNPYVARIRIEMPEEAERAQLLNSKPLRETIGGTDTMDKGNLRHGKIIWGALGFGSLKLALHRACIAQLFKDNKQVLDAENIFALAKEMA
jgi:hypothetical protein